MNATILERTFNGSTISIIKHDKAQMLTNKQGLLFSIAAKKDLGGDLADMSHQVTYFKGGLSCGHIPFKTMVDVH